MDEGSIKAITLDLDDTLWPVAPVLAAAERQLLDWLREQAPRTAEAIAAGFSLPDLKRRYPERAHDVSWMRLQFLRQTLASQAEDVRLAEPAFECFYQARQQVKPYQEVERVLAAWSGQYRLAVITNGNADVSAMPLGRYFDAVLSAHRFGVAKPDARIFHAACEALAVQPRQTLHIGDDWSLDFKAAIQAGLQAVWLQRPDLPGVAAYDGKHAGSRHRVFQDLLDVDSFLQQSSGKAQ